MCSALIGIVALQYTMLKESYAQKEMIFDQSVSSALIDVSKKVEKREAVNFIRTKITKPKKSKNNVSKSNTSNGNKKTKYIKSTSSSYTVNIAPPSTPLPDKLNDIESYDAVTVYDDARIKELDKNQRELEKRAQKQILNRQEKIKQLQDSLKKRQKEFEFYFNDEMFNPETFNFSGMTDSMLKLSFNVAPSYFEYRSDSGKIIIHKKPRSSKDLESIPRKGSRAIVRSIPEPPNFPTHTIVAPASPAPPANIVLSDVSGELKNVFIKPEIDRRDLIEEIATEMQVLTLPIEQRIDTNYIDSLIAVELSKRGIWQNYEVIIQTDNNSKVFYKTSDIDFTDNYAFYTIDLFENPDGKSMARINLSFPNKDKIISNQMGPSIVISILLLSTIISIFIYTIYAILKQKKLSDLKNDFINNMTHEFKTPVSTILLASEALKDNSILNDESRVKRLAGIIYDENQRLSEHVERVLNMAKMDKGEVKLAMNSVSLHEIIHECLNHFELNLENKRQNIELNLSAINDNIYVDVFHLKNIIHNLIDNASKYSNSNTTIFITTKETKSEIIFSVKDQGIGMKKEQMKKVFDPFYRVPTGNLHDVKGFGIGLHYVNSILKMMGGRITINSELGKGSEFSVYFNKNNF